MKNIFSKILVISILFISLTTTADYHVEKISETSGKNSLIKIWVKDNYVKVETEQNTKVYNRENDSIRYESHVLHSYWEGSLTEFINKRRLASKVPKEDQKQRKRKKKLNEDNARVTILPLKDSTDIFGYSCQKYQVLENDKLVETFYYTNKINLFKGLNYSIINMLINPISNKKAEYKNSDSYKDFITKGLIMKRDFEGKSDTLREHEEVMAVFNDEVIPDVFNIPDGYHLMPLEEIFKAESIELKNMNN